MEPNAPSPPEEQRTGHAASLVTLLSSLDGQRLDPARLIAILALYDVMAVIETLEGRPATASLPPSRSAMDNLPSMAASLLNMLQGPAGQKINPGALMNLVNLLGSQLGQRTGPAPPPDEERPVTGEAAAANPRSRLDWRRDWRKSPPEGGAPDTNSHSEGQG